MILTVAQTYPTLENMYNNGFVHARVKQYRQEGIDAKVYVIGNRSINKDYEIEGVQVLAGNSKRLADLVNSDTSIKCVCFHFLNLDMLKAIKRFRKDVRITIFVHGNEALWWYQRIFPDRFSGFIRILKFIKHVIINTYSMIRIRNSINHLGLKTDMVFVSRWMQDETFRNWKINKELVSTHIIPNLINENVFPFVEKTPESRYNILLIRQFTSGKYALDVAMDTICALENKPEADRISITVIGDGWLYDKYISRIKQYGNIHLVRGFLSHNQISEVHKKHGIFLCPTRQDAQGVSMCEAMSSGLVPISSPNTAIPEYLPDEYHLSFNDAESMANRIIELIHNETEFLELSKKVSSFIRNKCGITETIQKEMELMNDLSH